jgi:hypothetical protein
MNIAQFLEQRGHQQGLKQGLEQQRSEQGEQQTAERIARAMLANGLDLSLVAKLTGLAPEMSGPAAALIIPYPPAPRRSCGVSSLFSSMCQR